MAMRISQHALGVAVLLASLSYVWNMEPPPQRSSPPFYAGIAGVSNPVLKSSTSPIYPEKLGDKHLEAQLILQIVVKSDGTVGSIEALRCRVNKEPQKSLESFCDAFVTEAKIAVAKWVYEPAQYNGTPVDVFYTVVVDFRVHKSRPVLSTETERSNNPLHLTAGVGHGVEVTSGCAPAAGERAR